MSGLASQLLTCISMKKQGILGLSISSKLNGGSRRQTQDFKSSAHYIDYHQRRAANEIPNIIKHSTTTYIIFFHTIVLVFVSLLPAIYNMGIIYLTGVILGGSYFIWTSFLLAIKKTKDAAMKNFFASFIQLGLLLVLIIIDGIIVF